jgi:phosphatidylglycerophosphatase A
VSSAARTIATCFGIGRVPFAAGTVASLAALPLGWVLVYAGPRAVAIAAALAFALGVWACGAYAKKIGIKDPSECVIDEVAGQWIALAPIALEMRAFDWRPFAMAFFLFRLFDITKPWPIASMEKLKGGFGIMADDIAAGLFAALALYGMLAIQLI